MSSEKICRDALQAIVAGMAVGKIEPFFGKNQIGECLKKYDQTLVSLEIDSSFINQSVEISCLVWAKKLVADLRVGVKDPKYVLMTILSYLSHIGSKPSDVGLTLEEMIYIEHGHQRTEVHQISQWDVVILGRGHVEIRPSNQALVIA